MAETQRRNIVGTTGSDRFGEIYCPQTRVSQARIANGEQRSYRQRRLDCEKCARVVAENFLPHIGGKTLPAGVENFLRIGPGARGMRIIGSEHDFVGVENVADHLHAERVVDEANPNLPVKIFARQHFRKTYRAVACEPAAIARALIPDVQTLNHAWHPSESGFGHHDLDAGMAVEHAGENEPGHRLEKLYSGRLLREARRGGDHKIRCAASFVIEPGFFHRHGEMKSDRYADFFRQRPEGLPGFVVDGRLRT